MMSLIKPIPYYFCVLILLFVSCQKDTFNSINDERAAPVITMSTASDVIEAYEGQTVNAVISLAAQSGIASIQVTRNEESLETIEGISGQVERNYPIQYLVPEDASVGSSIVYHFVLEDRQGRRVEQDFTIQIVEAPPIPDFEFEDVTVGGQDYKLINLDINMDVTLSNEYDYLLRGKIAITQDATVTIEEGTQIYAEPGAALIVSTGTKLIAEGTLANPIRFTSLADRTGMGAAGDWIGIFVHGLAPTQGANNSVILSDIGQYGGTEDADDSGSLRYVEIAYAGAQISGNASSGALNLNGVGNGTEIEYIYVNNSGVSRSALVIAGGNVRIKYFFAYNANGRSILWREGYSGYMQFVVAHYDAGSGAGSWNDGYTAFDGYDAGSATSAPTLANISIQGGNLPTGSGNRGIRFRSGARGSVYNAWINGTGNPGLRTDATTDVMFAHGRVWGNSTNFHSSASGYNNSGSPYFNSTNPVTITDGYKGVETSGALDPTTLDAWFAPATYIGAVDPANDWTAGWISLP